MDLSFGLVALAATLLVGVLLGHTFTERALQARTRRQAAVQRLLNSQWQELASQRHELNSQRQELEIAQQAVAHRRRRESEPVRS